jgi:hypothetical protein
MCRQLPALIFVLLLLSGPLTSAQTVLDFQYHKSLVFLKVKINGSRTHFTFLLNTTATNTAIDKRTAAILKLPVVREIDTVVGTAGKEAVTICRINTLQAGDAIVKNLEVNTRDLSTSVTFNGQKIDGILGMDFLKKFAVTLDFKKHKIIFANKYLVGKQKFIPFELIDNVPRFSAIFNDTLSSSLNYNSAVSTENGHNIYVNVSYNQWLSINRTCPYLNKSGYVIGKGVGGNLYLDVVKLMSLQLDTIEIRRAYIVIQPKEGIFRDDNTVGFFGNNLLEKYNYVTFDFPRNRMIFNDIKKPPPTKKKRPTVINRIAGKL